MKKIGFICVLAALGGTATLALTTLRAEPGKPTVTSSAQAPSLSGADVYRTNCVACHGPNGEGTSTAPELVGIVQRLTDQEIRRVTEEGRGRMPGFGNLERAEVDALLGYLHGIAGQAPHDGGGVTVRPLGRADLGARLFQSNCASCHSNRSAKGWGHDCGMPLAGVTARFSKQQIENIIRHGICMMPSFKHLKDSEVEALYAYLESLPAPKDAQMTMGQMCPMVQDATRDEPTRAGCCGTWEPSRQVRGN